jgi:hypothetical protein
MVIHTFHQRSSLNFPLLSYVSSPRFKSLHFTSLIITFLTLFLKICDLQGKDYRASAGGCFQYLMVLLKNKYVPIAVLCLLALINYTSFRCKRCENCKCINGTKLCVDSTPVYVILVCFRESKLPDRISCNVSFLIKVPSHFLHLGQTNVYDSTKVVACSKSLYIFVHWKINSITYPIWSSLQISKQYNDRT